MSPVSLRSRKVRVCTSCSTCTEFHTYQPMLAMSARARAVASMTSRIGRAFAEPTLPAAEEIIDLNSFLLAYNKFRYNTGGEMRIVLPARSLRWLAAAGLAGLVALWSQETPAPKPKEEEAVVLERLPAITSVFPLSARPGRT